MGGGGGEGGGGVADLTVPAIIIWLLGHTRSNLIWVTTLQPPPPPPPPPCWVDARNKQNTDYSGETWPAGKAKLISPRVAVSLGEP